MGKIDIVGKVFTDASTFLGYLDGLQFGAWRPKFVTLHHTGAPDLAKWYGWKARGNPTDEQWLKNLAAYYGGLGWSAGPHFFITPRHICVLSSPVKRGVHAASFNAVSWGVEIVGNFDGDERLDGLYRDHAVSAMAAMHVALGIRPDGFRRGVSGLHFHRDDPKTTKTCPGKSIDKAEIVREIIAAMVRLTPGAHEDEKVSERRAALVGRVVVPSGETLNVRAAASGKAPSVRSLANGASVVIMGSAMNGTTKWLKLDNDEWVSARYVEIE